MSEENRIITVSDMGEYFQKMVADASEKLKIDFNRNTILYVADLMSRYASLSTLCEDTEDGVQIRPLAFLFEDAVNAEGPRVRLEKYTRLADRALFMSGYLPDSLDRKPVSRSYYIEMGQAGYGQAGAIAADIQIESSTYIELSEGFIYAADILTEVNQANKLSDKAMDKLYKRFLTGSKSAEDEMRARGVTPFPGPDPKKPQ